MRKARLFQNGQSQAVRLPNEFRFGGSEVFIKRMGNALVLLPLDGFWDSLLASLDAFTEDFLPERNQPEAQVTGSDTG